MFPSLSTNKARVKHLFQPGDRESGSSIVGFVLVVPLLVTVFVAVAQVVVLVADQSTLSTAATIGARSASAADATLVDGIAQAKRVLETKSYLREGTSLQISREKVSGVTYVRVSAKYHAEIPWINQTLLLKSTSRAVDEHSL